VVLYVGAETVLDKDIVEYGSYVQVAKLLGGIVVAAEHRFYGYSVPNGENPLSLENLRFLSSEQSLNDLADLIKVIQARYSLNNEDNPVISFGCSYGANLAAWSRIKYPHLIQAAVSSSGPVEASVKLAAASMIPRVFSDPKYGGSPECLNGISKSFEQIMVLLDSGDREGELQRVFSSCHPITLEEDKRAFIMSLAGGLLELMQYHGQFIGIFTMCIPMVNRTDLPEWKRLAVAFSSGEDENCSEYSYSKELESLKVELNTLRIMRQWMYQSCTEFGYFEDCTENCVLPKKYFNSNYSANLCSSLFGIHYEQVEKNVFQTNEKYGGNHLAGSRIIFVNGLVDPWSKLSVLRDLSNDLIAITIANGSHCIDEGSGPILYPVSEAAREETFQILSRWLGRQQKSLRWN
jgi:thymus-specific serine protease